MHRTVLGIVLAVAACTGDEDEVSTNESALTADQCNYFAVNGKTRICHATGSTKNPYTVLNVSGAACVTAHAAHPSDYVAVDDPTCHGGGYLPPNAPCDATLPCGSGYECRAGTCQPTDRCAGVSCSPSDQCHVAYCDSETGRCVDEAKVDGFDCNDGDACTQTDRCVAGRCIGTDPVTCIASDACHEAGVCDPATGACSQPTVPDGTGCADGDACTQTDVCVFGRCLGGDPVTCTASDQCHGIGTCDPSSGTCSSPVFPDGTSCNDGDACTLTDACRGGACTGADPVICAAADQCHGAGVCDSMTGACSQPVLPDGTACADGDACTRTDVCLFGRCLGGDLVTCTASDQCHGAGTCDPGTGACSNPVLADGTTCNDSDACTHTDICRNGACTGQDPVVCVAADQCRMPGVCDPTTGECSIAFADGVPCNDGNVYTLDDRCRAGECAGTFPKPHPPVGCHSATWSDPHFETWDGLYYDFQGAGEFTLTTDDRGFTVQIRLEEVAENVTIPTAIATKLGADRVGFYGDRSPPLLVNGAPTVVPPEGLFFPDGSRIDIEDGRTVLSYASGQYLILQANPTVTGKPVMAVPCDGGQPSNGGYRGLLGNHDTNAFNDITDSNGNAFGGPVGFDTMMGPFLTGWRIIPDGSYFDYEPGESAATFGALPQASAPVSAMSVIPSALTDGTFACAGVGVTQQFLINPCSIDVALTGDTGYAGISLAIQTLIPPPTAILDFDHDGVSDGVDTCPSNTNPLQSLATDPANCGSCGHSCGGLACTAGSCAIPTGFNFGGASTDTGEAIAAMPDGGVVFGGTVRGNVFGQTSHGNQDGFVARVSATGALLWVRLSGGTQNDAILGVAADTSGNVYAVGYTPNASDLDAYIEKRDPNGNLVWKGVYALATFATDSASAVAIDPQGNPVVLGTSAGTFTTITVTKFAASNGAKLWSTTFTNSTAASSAGGVAVASDGSVYVSATLAGSGTFAGLTKPGDRDAVLRKYDGNGTLQWTRFVGSASADFAQDVAIGATPNDVYLLGDGVASIDGQTFAGNYDGFVAKFDAAGTKQWVAQFGGPGTDHTSRMVARGNALYITGQTNGQIAGTQALGSTDAYVLRMMDGGFWNTPAFVWAASTETGNGIAFAGPNVAIVGTTNGDLGGGSAGFDDAFVFYLAPP